MTRVQKFVVLAVGVGIIAGATAGLVAGVLLHGEGTGRPRPTDSKRPRLTFANEKVGYMNGIWVDAATWDPNDESDDTGDEWALSSCRSFRYLGGTVAPRGDATWGDFLLDLDGVIAYGRLSSTPGIADAAREFESAVDRAGVDFSPDLYPAAASMLVACERAGT
jgi:hypothetical protein